nr:SPFH domain-containing protein [uncultured Desulfobacter sp.]
MIRCLQSVLQTKIQAMPLKQALFINDELFSRVETELKANPSLDTMGVEILDLSIAAISPSPETAKALEAKQREEILKQESDADAYAISAKMKAYKELSADYIKALAMSQMNLEQIMASAFESFAQNASKIGEVNIGQETFGRMLRREMNNDGQQILAVNDLSIGPRTHQSARYRISWADKAETQSSSGIIVSTGFGSTGWFQSILAGAMAVAETSGPPLENGFAWDEKRLQFSVREPFPSRTTGIGLVFGDITQKKLLEIESMMPENGVIFSDGIENDCIAFNSDTIAKIGLSKKAGQLVWKN